MKKVYVSCHRFQSGRRGYVLHTHEPGWVAGEAWPDGGRWESFGESHICPEMVLTVLGKAAPGSGKFREIELKLGEEWEWAA